MGHMTEGPQQQKVAGWFLRNWEWVLALVCGVGVFFLYRDYGLGWDTAANTRYGENILDYFLDGMRHPMTPDVEGAEFYGPLFDLPSAIVHRLLGKDPLALRGLLSAWFAVATLPAVAKIARRIGGERLAVFAVLALILTPQFFGQAFINSKDIPLACTVAWAVLAICRLVEDKSASWPNMLGLALAFGAVLSARIGAVFIFGFLGAALLWRLLPHMVDRQWRELLPPRPGVLAFKVAVALLVGWFLVVAAWPYAHQNPLRNPYEALRVAASYPKIYTVLFNGELIAGNVLPPSYLPTYVLLNYSPVLLGLVLLGGGSALLACVRRWRERPTAGLFLVLCWIAAPLAGVLILRPNIYDGARHFIFLLPALAILAGRGTELVTGFLSQFGGRVTEAAGLVTMAVLALLPLVRWHPYQYAYLNFLAGERATLHRKFETDYWKTSYKAAAEWLNDQQELSPRPFRVVVAASSMSSPCLLHFLDPRMDVQLTMENLDDQHLPVDVDYYVGTTRFRLDENFNRTPVVWEERRDGVLFCVIRSARQAAAATSAP